MDITNECVKIIGGGLAGCECAYQLAKRGIKVKLYEQKPIKFSEAHTMNGLCELVCSNSLKSMELTNSCGLLKRELKMLDSLVISCAEKCSVGAGSALAVDRDKLSELVTQEIQDNKNIEIIYASVENINTDEYTVIATGPLTSDALSKKLQLLLGQDYLYFYDAVAPIVSFDSLNLEKVFIADRFDRGDGDYLNCGLNKTEYEVFVKELVGAKRAKLRDFENIDVFEGCMPVEIMASRGKDALRFGPMKPVGITNPKTGERYYAVVQLRKENDEGTAYNLVGFQTNLTFVEQKRVFGLIHGLENAEIIRYGVMHRNTFISAPDNINEVYQLIKYPKLFIAGQLSGVEGYVESIASGLIAGINMGNMILGDDFIKFSSNTAIGSLGNKISQKTTKKFEPTNSNYAIINDIEYSGRDKNEKRLLIANRAIQEIEDYLKTK